MTDTRSFLLQIAKENNIPESRVLPVIEKLEEDWYDKAETLKELSDSQFSALSVPGRLVELIKKKLLTEDPPALESSLEALVEDLNSRPEPVLQTCLETLKLLLSNILKSSDQKFRKLNKSNPNFYSKIGQFSSAVTFLVSLGFQDSGDFLILQKESPGLLESQVLKLEELLDSMISSKFNPFVSGITSTNPEVPKILSRENDPLAISSEIKRLKSQEFPRIERNPQVFKVEGNASLFFKTLDEETSEKDEEVAQLANIQTVMRQREEFSTFRNKRKNELNKLKEFLPVKATIRVKFPDKIVLQGEFSVKETARDLYQFVRSHLVQEGREFFLYENPLKRTIKDGSHVLQPLAPATILYFAWTGLDETNESHGPFINN